jgi:hypothetical protein
VKEPEPRQAEKPHGAASFLKRVQAFVQQKEKQQQERKYEGDDLIDYCVQYNFMRFYWR